MEKRSIGVGVIFNYIFSFFHRFTNLSLYTFIIFLHFIFYLSLYFIRFSIQTDNIIIICYLICICFLSLFLFLFFYLYDNALLKEKPICVIETDTNLILCLSTNKIIKQDNLVSVYVRGNFNLKKQILFIKSFLHLINYNNNKVNFLFLYNLCSDPIRLFILLSQFSFLYSSFFIFYNITFILKEKGNYLFLYRNNKLNKIKKKVLNKNIKNKQARLFIKYIYYEYYKCICNNISLDDLSNQLNGVIDFYFCIYSVKKHEHQLYLDINKLKKKHILLFLHQFYIINKINPMLLNKYLSLIKQLNIKIKTN